MKKLLPRIVYQMCVHGGLIVGSQARRLAGEDVKPNDWDILVPIDRWWAVASFIPGDATPNKFGGWRFESDGIEIDVWPDTVMNYLTRCKNSGGSVLVVDFINNRVFSSRFQEV